MDSDQPPSETSEDPKPPSTTTEPQQTTTHIPRSYECNFCKRGFTNAQALGGHMNIHRKDKPKFKYSTITTPPIATVEPPSPNRRTVADPFVMSHQGNLLLLDRHDDVDLELRLGHVEVEPPPKSSSDNITTTRKFF